MKTLLLLLVAMVGSMSMAQSDKIPSPMGPFIPTKNYTPNYVADYGAFYLLQVQIMNRANAVWVRSNDLSEHGGVFPASESALINTLMNPSAGHMSATFAEGYDPVTGCPAHPDSGNSSPFYAHEYIHMEKKEVNENGRKWQDCLSYLMREYNWVDASSRCDQRVVIATACWNYN